MPPISLGTGLQVNYELLTLYLSLAHFFTTCRLTSFSCLHLPPDSLLFFPPRTVPLDLAKDLQSSPQIVDSRFQCQSPVCSLRWIGAVTWGDQQPVSGIGLAWSSLQTIVPTRGAWCMHAARAYCIPCIDMYAWYCNVIISVVCSSGLLHQFVTTCCTTNRTYIYCPGMTSWTPVPKLSIGDPR